MEKTIFFHVEDIEMPNFSEEWITDTLENMAEEHKKEIHCLNYIFCSDEYLLEMNKEYLQHDYYTDIITFDNADDENSLLSDMFISVDRVIDNAEKLKIDPSGELYRVLIHGVLHLLGFNDKTEEEQKEMREKENHYLINVPRGTPIK